MKMGLVREESECGGHGIWLEGGGGCICDLGWKGAGCQEVSQLHRPGKVDPKTVLMVVDWFGPLDLEHENAIYYTTLAGFLAKSGYKVTVMQTRPVGPQWEALKKLYEGRGIRLMTVPNVAELPFELGNDSKVSYWVFRYLADSPSVYEHVFLLSSSGSGFYTLQAQRQGQICLASHFVVGIDGLTEVRQEQVRKGWTGRPGQPEASQLVSDRGVLMREWMLQRSVELADTVITTSKALLDSVLEQGWKVPDNVYVLPYLTVPVAAAGSDESKSGNNIWERADELIPSRQAQVREFVFVGRLGSASGLNLFTSAIDNVLSRDQKAHRKYLKGRPLKVTFWGVNDLVGSEGDLTGEHHIELKAHGWSSRVKWSVRSQDGNMKRLIRYLTEPGKGRLAIVPSLMDSSSFFLQQALRAGVPVMASNVRSAQECVHIQDRREVLFATNDTVALARKMLDAWNNGSTT